MWEQAPLPFGGGDGGGVETDGETLQPLRKER